MNKLLLCIALLLATSLRAQVTIGSAQIPAQGALLDLKQETDGSSKRGLGMPRVQLQNIAKLKMSATGTEYTDKLAHTGLAVYNVSGDANPKCASIPDGLYVWDGGKWQGIGVSKVDPASLNLGPKTTYYFPSGLGILPIVAQNFTATWLPANPLTYIQEHHATFGGISFSNITGNNMAISPTIFSMTPDVMTADPTNPFQTKETTLIFSATSECGPTKANITLNQTNKALSITPPTTLHLLSSVTKTATISSNAKWKLSGILPTTNSAITSTDLNVVKGTELTDGTGTANTVSYNLTIGADKARYNYLTFSDNETPKRFDDVMITVIQCDTKKDLTMEQHKNRWEEMYGLIPGVDEPNSNGNTTKNINQVQWHKDQDGNIFFSSMFGTERWMTTNLAATSYATNSPNKPNLVNSYENSYTVAHWGYPNEEGNPDPGLTTQYNLRERIGLLYNWFAATGNQNLSTTNQGNIPHGPHQGICPNNWHVPTNLEWTNLLTELIANYQKYSHNTYSPNTMVTAKDTCEPYYENASFEFIEGGLSLMLTGSAGGGMSERWSEVGSYWSSSSYSGMHATSLQIAINKQQLSQFMDTRTKLKQVRCKFDN